MRAAGRARAASARAPSSTANLGPGFDVFGLALDAFYDTVRISRSARPGVRVRAGGGVPQGARSNTAGVVASRMAREFGARGGLEVEVRKGVPAGLGLGSSAASAAAAAAAFDSLFGLGLGGPELVRHAGAGERASAGAVHYDNVAASLLGGFVIVRGRRPDVVRVPPPRGLSLCVAIPDVEVPAMKTRAARAAVPREAPVADCVSNVANAAAMVAGFMRGDPGLIGGAAADAIVEPARAGAIPGLARVRAGALRAGAAGVAISGAGPSVVAFARGARAAPAIARAMAAGFAAAGVGCRTVACRPAGGARARLL